MLRIRNKLVVAGRGVSIQITTLKVLSGHPEGRASHADVTRSVAILMSSGADWSNRMKRVAARAPDLSIFSSGYVIRDKSGWQITMPASPSWHQSKHQLPNRRSPSLRYASQRPPPCPIFLRTWSVLRTWRSGGASAMPPDYISADSRSARFDYGYLMA